MSYEGKKFGSEGERRAARFLKRKGYDILGKNVTTKLGEIDILAQDGETIVIVEVKAKADAHRGSPEEMVDWKKQRKLVRLSRQVMQKFPTHGIRIDVVAIEGKELRHHISAVQEN